MHFGAPPHLYLPLIKKNTFEAFFLKYYNFNTILGVGVHPLLNKLNGKKDK